jgi:hypothetical protein
MNSSTAVSASFTRMIENIIFRSQSSPKPETLLTRQKWGCRKGELQSVYRGSVKFIWILLKSWGFLFYKLASCSLLSGWLCPCCFLPVDSNPTATNRGDNTKLVIT